MIDGVKALDLLHYASMFGTVLFCSISFMISCFISFFPFFWSNNWFGLDGKDSVKGLENNGLGIRRKKGQDGAGTLR